MEESPTEATVAQTPSPATSPVAAPPPGTVEVKEEAKPEEAGVDVRDMTRLGGAVWGGFLGWFVSF